MGRLRKWYGNNSHLLCFFDLLDRSFHFSKISAMDLGSNVSHIQLVIVELAHGVTILTEPWVVESICCKQATLASAHNYVEASGRGFSLYSSFRPFRFTLGIL